MENLFIFDCEVFAHDWLFVFKERSTGEYTIIHNDNDAVVEFMNLKRPMLCGFNSKHYDCHILKAVMLDFTPEEIKAVNDTIIVDGVNGWNIPALKESKIFFNSFDLMDDCQQGTSLKSFEAHLGINIKESDVDFNIDRPLTDTELDETIFYCKYDVDATERLFELRQAYLNNKLTLGATKGLEPARALYMTNAKLTSVYLDAHYPDKGWDDARKYRYPDKLLNQYIPAEVFSFFNRMYDSTISDDDLYDSKLDITVGDCPCTIAFGGIHGAIPTYMEEATETRTIRNKDVASYYPHLMTLMGYCSRNIPSPAVYEKTLDDRVAAKRAGNKAVANALKLVLDTVGVKYKKSIELYQRCQLIAG